MSVPRLSLWHCKAYFVLTSWDLRLISEYANIDYKVIVATYAKEEWERLKYRYNQLTPKKRKNLEYIDLLLDANDESRIAFVSELLNKVDASVKEKSKESRRSHYAQKIAEFGGSLAQAQNLLARYEREIAAAPDADLSLDADTTIIEKLDAMNAGYDFLAESVAATGNEMRRMLGDSIQLWNRMIVDLKAKYPQDAEFKDLVSCQRNLSYAAQSMAKLVDQYNSLSGYSKYIDCYAAIAGLKAEGYYVIHKTQLGELAQLNDASIIEDE